MNRGQRRQQMIVIELERARQNLRFIVRRSLLRGPESVATTVVEMSAGVLFELHPERGTTLKVACTRGNSSSTRTIPQ